MVSTPDPPDPIATANAQTASNEQTANYQTALNDTSQITPYGNITYAQTGTDSTGAPERTATTTLSPALQTLEDSNIANSQGNSNLMGQLQTNAASTLSKPLDLSYGATQAQLDKENAFTMDPQWARNDAAAQQTAYDQGSAPGSQGYTTAISNEGLLKDNAYASAYGADQSQAQNTLEAEYNSPLNALSALQSGSQVSQPGVGTLAPTAQTGVAPTDVSGIIEQNYAQQVSQSNAAMGGLFGLAGSLGSGLLQGAGKAGSIGALLASDRRLKTDIVEIGMSPKGLPIYSFRYIWGGPTQIGHMAHEVARVSPHAVHEIGGFLHVDYGAI